MCTYELIKDLERKLELFSHHHGCNDQPPNQIHEIVAHLIVSAQIYPRILDRETIRGLVEERKPWPTKDGGECCLARPVELQALEDARVVRIFQHDVKFAGRAEVEPGMPETLRDQLNAYTFLYEINYSAGELASPHLRIPSSNVSECEMRFLEPFLELEGDAYRITVGHKDVSAVGSCVWTLLETQHETADEAFADYARRMYLAHGDTDVFSIDYGNSETYLESAYNYLLTDATLHQGWQTCAADIALSYHRIGSLIKVFPAAELDTQTNQPAPQFADSLRLSTLQRHISEVENQNQWTLLEKIEWWKQDGNPDDFDQTTAHLARFIIRSENNLFYKNSSFPLTRQMIEVSQSLPKLVKILFQHHDYPPYQCYLLSQWTTSHIGLIGIYKTLRRSTRAISENVDYETKWNDLLWMQAIEIFTESFDIYLNEADIECCMTNICEMVVWFSQNELGHNSRHKSITETRLPGLRHVIERLQYVGPGGQHQSLIDNNLTGIFKAVRASLAATIQDGTAPLGEWSILFWCFDWLSKQAPEYTSMTPAVIGQVIIDSYLDLMEMRSNGPFTACDDGIAIEEFDWHRALEMASRLSQMRLIHLLDESKLLEQKNDSDKKRSIAFSARTHLRLLINLMAKVSQNDRTEVLPAIVLIIRRFGFTQDAFLGGFDHMYDKSNHSPIRLWPSICDMANEFTPEEFTKFLAMLDSCNAPVSALLTLLEKSAPYGYKKQILDVLNKRDLSSEQPNWMPEVIDVILKAINSGNTKIALHFLQFAKKHAHKTFNNQIEEIASKIELKAIFDDNTTQNDDKLEALRAYATQHNDRQVAKEVTAYKAYLISLLNIELDSTKALSSFVNLLRSNPSLENATGILQAVLQWPENSQPPAPLLTYFEMWMQTYDTLRPGNRHIGLSDHDLNYILQMCLKLSRLDVFSDLWEKATRQQRMTYELAPVRVEHLKKTNRLEEAKKYLDDLIRIHQGAPQEILDELSHLETTLSNENSSLVHRATPSPTPEIISSHQQLRTLWLNILAKDGYAHSQIFHEPSDSVNNFLFSAIEQVCCELLARTANLQRKKEIQEKSNVILMDEENMINDWLTSLLDLRLRFAGWSISDQTRMGHSGSGKGVGELDGLIRDNHKNYISLIEAFRLGDFLAKNTIKVHLDKLSRYNSVGLSPLFVIVYTSADDFEGLCQKYKEHVESIDYHGFDAMGGRLEKAPMTLRRSAARHYVETRRFKGEEITIYHHLLDFRMK